MNKHPGGRGRKATDKHAVFSVSLPPHLKSLLDSWVTEEVSRSEVIARLIEAQAQAEASTPVAITPLQSLLASVVPLKSSGEAKGESTSQAVASPSTGLTTPKKKKPAAVKRTDALPDRVEVLTTAVPRGLKWKPQRYIEAEELLSHGSTLTQQPNGADWLTEKGAVMSWRTIDALLSLGIIKKV